MKVLRYVLLAVILFSPTLFAERTSGGGQVAEEIRMHNGGMGCGNPLGGCGWLN